MTNIVEAKKEKTVNFIEKYALAKAEYEAADGDLGIWYESLDENYDIVFFRLQIVGSGVAITDKYTRPEFFYLKDDEVEWKDVDVLLGYLELYGLGEALI